VTSIEPQQQLEFLSNIQRLLGEGQFTATYKYALLMLPVFCRNTFPA
jgi:hypothetical protein